MSLPDPPVIPLSRFSCAFLPIVATCARLANSTISTPLLPYGSLEMVLLIRFSPASFVDVMVGFPLRVVWNYWETFQRIGSRQLKLR